MYYYDQVLSDTVSKALYIKGKTDPIAKETAKFVEYFDKFFDSLNVSNYVNGKYERKVFQDPYRSGSDFRLKVNNGIKNQYLAYT